MAALAEERSALGGKGGDKKEGLLAFHIKDHTLHTHTRQGFWVLIQGGGTRGQGFEELHIWKLKKFSCIALR